MPKSHPTRRLFGLLLLALIVSLLMLLWDVHGPISQPLSPSSDDTAASDNDAGTPTLVEHKQQHAPAAACAPHARQACREGDLWWFDSCGTPTEPSQSCDGRGCDDDHCRAPPHTANPCGTINAYGICEGDVAKACVVNRVLSYDCSDQRGRCVMTSEGARCMPRDDKLACSERDVATCLGDRLRQCIDGRWAVIDCALRKATCNDRGGEAHCESPVALSPNLGPPEVCDGLDNDNDGKVDEAGVCDPVPLVAFIPNGAKLANLETRMQDELAIMNRIYAPRRFAWAKTLPAPGRYRNFDPRELEDAAVLFSQLESKSYIARQRAADPSAASGGDDGLDFYVAVLFSEKLRLDPPKSGISTLPNAECGGIRISDNPSPPHGVIVLTEARSPETLAHEMGHYLGLCHTHEELARFAVNAPRPECLRTGDGICDTPFDPGPSSCSEQEPCDLACRQSSAHPDATNVMSYYIGCRRVLSAEQLAETERGLALRRGWFHCLDPRDCVCNPAQANNCPDEMSCHPGQTRDAAWSCELDGPGLAGAPCRDASQCADAGFCVSQDGAGSIGHCTRPCYGANAVEGCTCRDVGLGFPVCGEDLR